MEKKQPLQWQVPADEAGRRLDNFLISRLRHVPKSALYRFIRQKKIRVDSKRAQPLQKLSIGQLVSAHLYLEKPADAPICPTFDFDVIYQQEKWLILNKPAGMAVHAGGKFTYGLIEAFRAQYQQPWELAHRLDKHTSGCLLLAKGQQSLRHWHQLFRERQGILKFYLAIVHGKPKWQTTTITAALTRLPQTQAKQMHIDPQHGKPCTTQAWQLGSWQSPLGSFSVLALLLHTGRMHQIRVHLASVQHPVLGDFRYGISSLDQKLAAQGITGMALHACAFHFSTPAVTEPLFIQHWPITTLWQRLWKDSRLSLAELQSQFDSICQIAAKEYQHV